MRFDKAPPGRLAVAIRVPSAAPDAVTFADAAGGDAAATCGPAGVTFHLARSRELSVSGGSVGEANRKGAEAGPG